MQNERSFRFRIRALITLYSMYTLAFVAYFILVRMAFFQVEHDYIISWGMAVSVYVIGYLEYRQTELPGLLPKYSSSSLTPAAVNSIACKLEKHMEEQSAYRNNELRLNDLAEDLGVSPHHLSQVINERYDKTFTQVVNEYRIREAQDLLSSEQHRQTYIIEIAYQVGFNNKTTFNQAFKAHTGMSPTQWRNRYLAQVAGDQYSVGPPTGNEKI